MHIVLNGSWEALRRTLAGALICAAAFAPAFAPAASAETILISNVRGYTPTADGSSRFDALLIEDGHVRGTLKKAEISRLQIYVDKRVDGGGKAMLPGLIDAHGHVMALGESLMHVDLAGAKSLDEALARIAEGARNKSGGGWLLGRGWNQVIWKLGRFPTRQELDAAVKDRPVYMSRVDGHAAWANSKALELAGIGRDTPDPNGGRIERDAAGDPSGVLVDAAMALVEKAIPAPSFQERKQALNLALAELRKNGLTSVHDAGVTPEEWRLYIQTAYRDRMTTRIYAMIAGARENFTKLSKYGPIKSVVDDRLSLSAVKLYADGALGSRGAAMLAPYSDHPGNKGLLFESDAAIRNLILRAVNKGYQVAVHAIGDAANRQVLDAFEEVRKYRPQPLRHRIEHAQVIAPRDIPRFAQLEIIASIQPTHATSDKNMAEDRVGSERLKGAYAWRKLLDAGARIAAGSDFPVEPVNPFYGLHAAVTRRDRDGHPPEGWRKAEALSVAEAVRAFTLDAAYAAHQENILGSLEPGKWADFILVDQDIFSIDPQNIWRTKVLETWLAGAPVYKADDAK